MKRSMSAADLDDRAHVVVVAHLHALLGGDARDSAS